MNWKKFGYIIASKYRMKIVLSLSASPKTPKEVAQELDLYISHVSSTLSDLSKEGIVECLNPSQKRGRIFSLTNIGKELAEELEKRKGLLS
jgi:DNA-binding MarR family transcriptional regulator